MQRDQFGSPGPTLAGLKVRSSFNIRTCHSGSHTVKFWVFQRMEILLEISTGFLDFLPADKSSTSQVKVCPWLSHKHLHALLGSFLTVVLLTSDLWAGFFLPGSQLGQPKTQGLLESFASAGLPLLPPPPLSPAPFQWTSARSCAAAEVMPFSSGKYLAHLECHQSR